MSFTIVEQATPRLNRSELAVPGSRTELFEKAAKSDVDVIFLDCEDAVAPDEKEKARKNIIQALNDIDWGTKTISVRINGLDTHYMYRDVVDILDELAEVEVADVRRKPGACRVEIGTYQNSRTVIKGTAFRPLGRRNQTVDSSQRSASQLEFHEFSGGGLKCRGGCVNGAKGRA